MTFNVFDRFKLLFLLTHFILILPYVIYSLTICCLVNVSVYNMIYTIRIPG